MSTIRFLHTNDLHGKLDESRLPALLEARTKANFYFDTGDCISAGNLAIPLSADKVWAYLDQAHCTASVPGNRESHILQSVVDKKFQGVRHPVLCANWQKTNGEHEWQDYLVLHHGDLKIGVFGVMVPMVTSRMKTRFASQFLWSQPIEAAHHIVNTCRNQVDLLIALTHIGFKNDEKLAQTCPEIDIIFGGHSHTVLESPVQIGKTWIAQGGSHGRYLGMYEWNEGGLTGGLQPWKI